MSTQINLYDLLGVKSDADEAEIKRAYRKLATKTHPDVGGEAMASLFMGIQKAYETLSDPETRAEYDRSLSGTQERSAGNSGGAGTTSRNTRRRNSPPPSYEWAWIDTIVPTTKRSLGELVPKLNKSETPDEDTKRNVRARYTQRFPFAVIFSIAVLIWFLSLGLRNSAPMPQEIVDAPMFRLLSALQVASLGALLVAVFAKKLKALKAFIGSLVTLLYLIAPSIIAFGTTRTFAFVPPPVLAVVTTLTLVGSGIAIIWSLHERSVRAMKMKATGIPKKVNDWTVIDIARGLNAGKPVRHAQQIAEMVASKLPGTKVLFNLPGKSGQRNSIIVFNGKRLALVEVMDVSARNGGDDISGYAWDEFPWRKSAIGAKPAVLQNMLPKDVEVKSFLMVYPAHAGKHAATYKVGERDLEVNAVSDVELGNVMGQWLAEGADAGAVDKDLLYGLVAREPLSKFL